MARDLTDLRHRAATRGLMHSIAGLSGLSGQAYAEGPDVMASV